MGQFRSQPDHPGNIIDRLTTGIGHRGSSMSDVDRLTIVHDGSTPPRFLFQETKWESERLSDAQTWWLKDLTSIPTVDVWVVRLLDSGAITIRDLSTGVTDEVTADEYRQRFGRWWNPADPSRDFRRGWIDWREAP